jgi:O-antigen/teichoic acid export membrane protein
VTGTADLRASLAGRAVSGFVWNHAGKLLDYGTQYLFSIVVVRHLSVNENATYAVLATTLQVALVASALGLEELVNRFVPQLSGAGRLGSVLYLFRRAFGVRVTAAIVVAGAMVWAAPLLAEALRLSPESVDLLRWLGLLLVARAVINFWTSALLGRLRAQRATLTALVGRAVELASLVWFFSLGLRLAGVLLALGVGAAAVGLLYIPVMRGELLGASERVDLKAPARFAAAVWGNLWVGLLLGRQLDVVLLTRLARVPGAVAHYDVARTLYGALSGAIGLGFAGISLSVFAEIMSHSPERSGNTYMSLVKLLAVPVVGVFIFAAASADTVVPLLYSERYAASVRPFRIFAGGIILGALFGGGLNTDVLLAGGKAAFLTGMGLMGGLLNLILDLVLIPWGGATGAALASTLAGTASVALISWLVRRQHLLRFPWRLWGSTLLAFGFGALPVLAWPPKSVVGLFSCLLFYVPVAVGALLLFRPFDPSDVAVLGRLPFGLAAFGRRLVRVEGAAT